MEVEVFIGRPSVACMPPMRNVDEKDIKLAPLCLQALNGTRQTFSQYYMRGWRAIELGVKFTVKLNVAISTGRFQMYTEDRSENPAIWADSPFVLSVCGSL